MSRAIYLVAALWVLGGVSLAFRLNGMAKLAALPMALMGIAYLRWPAVMRWPLIIISALGPAAFAAEARWYFHTTPLYGLYFKCLCAVLAQWLLMFGKTTKIRWGLGVAFLLATAGAPLPDPQSSAAMLPQVCSERIDALIRKVKPYAIEPSFEIVTHSTKLPSMARGKRAWEASAVIEVAPTGQWLGEQLPDDITQAADELRQRIERIYPKDEVVPLAYLAADANRNVQDISVLLSRLPKLHLMLLARAEPGPTGSPPLGAKDFAMRLNRAQNGSERASILGEELGRRAGPCRLLSKRMSDLKNYPIEEQPQLLIGGLETGLRDCHCSWVDIDALEYLIMRLLNFKDLDYFMVSIPWDPNGHLSIPNDRALTVEAWLRELATSQNDATTATPPGR